MHQVKSSFIFCSLIFCFFFISSVPLIGQKPAVIEEAQQGIEKPGQDLQEKLYIHTDKNFYIAGEVIWFKIYYVDASLHQPLHTSKIAYAEIMDRNNVPVLQAKISLDEKGGMGSFYLPLSLSSDNYILRAYTSWMKNFGPSVYFEKQLSIVNTVKASPASLKNDSPGMQVVFFPEGGRLVNGIETKVGFRISDQNGKGVDVKGLVVNNKGDTIQQFSSYKFGLGSFVFKPMEGYNYSAILLFPGGRTMVRPLPAADAFGYVMNVTDNKNGVLQIKVQVKKESAQNNGENVYLLVHTKKSLKKLQQGYVSNTRELVFSLDKEQLGEGVSYLTLLDGEQKAVCERLVFIPPHQEMTAVISSDKKKYGLRKEVDLTVSFPGGARFQDSVNCSVSVFQIDSLQSMNLPDIKSYLWLTSYLQGYVESPDYYFSDDIGVREATDNLMLTQGWRQLRQDNSFVVLKFKPEDNGHHIVGRVINTKTGKLVANARCYLSVPANPYGFYIKQSDSTGFVHFEVKNYYGPGDIIPQLDEEERSNYRIDIMSPFTFDSLYKSPFRFSVGQKNENFLREKSIGMQTQNIYLGDSLRKFMLPYIEDTLPFFGRAEYSYMLDDYKRFTTMEEVLREYVLPINVSLRNSNFYMSIFDEPMKTFYRNNMLVLLDGVPLRDPNKIFTYDPLKVKKLDVVSRRYIIGPLIFWGVASFETYEGKFSAFELDTSLVAVDYEGLQLQREFYSPVYKEGSQRGRIPDFRTTLYWLPGLNGTVKNTYPIQFYTSDQQGKFFVMLEGISSKGETISAVTSFVVE